MVIASLSLVISDDDETVGVWALVVLPVFAFVAPGAAGDGTATGIGGTPSLSAPSSLALLPDLVRARADTHAALGWMFGEDSCPISFGPLLYSPHLLSRLGDSGPTLPAFTTSDVAAERLRELPG